MKNETNILKKALKKIYRGLRSFYHKYCPLPLKCVYRALNMAPRIAFRYIFYNAKQWQYKGVLEDLRKKHPVPFRVGFYVITDADWCSRPVFELMMRDKSFLPKIIVHSDTLRGKENEMEGMEIVAKRLAQKYGAEYVQKAFDEETQEYKDFADDFDLISLANPYDAMTHKYYGMKHLAKKNKLVFHNEYGYCGQVRYSVGLRKLNSFNLFWKLFADNPSVVEMNKKEQYIHGKNTVLSGSCKMDNLAKVAPPPLLIKKSVLF